MDCKEEIVDSRIPDPKAFEIGSKNAQILFKLNHTMPMTEEYGKAVKELFGDKTIKELAAKYKKSPAQIILRWHVQEGFSTIPGARNPDYIKENIEVYNFKLSEDDMKKIRGLDKEKRFFTSTLAEIQHFKDWNPGD